MKNIFSITNIKQNIDMWADLNHIDRNFCVLNTCWRKFHLMRCEPDISCRFKTNEHTNMRIGMVQLVFGMFQAYVPTSTANIPHGETNTVNCSKIQHIQLLCDKD